MSMTISSSVGSHHGDTLKTQLPVVQTELRGDTLKVTAPESLANLKLVVPTLKNNETEHPELKRIEIDFSPVHQEAQRSREHALAHIAPILCHLVKWKGNNQELSVQIAGLSDALQSNQAIHNFSNLLEFEDPVCPESPLKIHSFGRSKNAPPQPIPG